MRIHMSTLSLTFKCVNKLHVCINNIKDTRRGKAQAAVRAN